MSIAFNFRFFAFFFSSFQFPFVFRSSSKQSPNQVLKKVCRLRIHFAIDYVCLECWYDIWDVFFFSYKVHTLHSAYCRHHRGRGGRYIFHDINRYIPHKKHMQRFFCFGQFDAFNFYLEGIYATARRTKKRGTKNIKWPKTSWWKGIE